MEEALLLAKIYLAEQKIRVVASPALGQFDAEPEIDAALRGHTLRGTCTVQACRRNVQFPRLWSNLESALFCLCVNRSADA